MKLLVAFLALLLPLQAFEIPSNSKQAIVGIAKDWNSSHVTLQIYEKSGNTWKPVTQSWQGRLGKKGLAWGRGIHPTITKPYFKRESDWRAPAGVFWVGKPYGAYGTHASIKKHRSLDYTQVTTRDLWVEDSSSPYYNRHLRIDHEPSSKWEKKAQMRQNDYPHSLKLYISHNTATSKQKAVPNGGSAIFFHIWRRDGKAPTAGCTTMHETQLRNLIARLDPNKNPVYILLPQAEYTKYKSVWKLP
ncbi:L,D-peptidoglycan transpeptidase YkuD, ErfK/YbiS/YcfS/YnhG family [Rubritalea squalenifaciens DSM 18772]|uniref:L,D-peptidoglycan transpeptidase YkuD, ErfK/YbiS/YcfS/YnhG family n=1 Tax=Rubritalea squalenifaciens DSM 18772 TaxID=1123071 RepID=A0A1M6NMT4_9BACT|nr:hypothetical protein [Rubritalea squalenifaciens]SHJ96944.1 L,D-peptidoglycan transpeptidase YkuD, ErfK/YbiS/YcfS/YnhG family [Rubritalea squalenifaciens DSM 18772]